MIHLIPYRDLLKFLLIITGIAILSVISLGLFGDKSFFQKSVTITSYLMTADTILGVILYFLWHRISYFTNKVFPYINGEWSGNICYKIGDNIHNKDATLLVMQNLLEMHMILETDESISQTMIVYPKKDEIFPVFKLFYIFENRRKEGVNNANQSYRGTAIIRLAPGKPNELDGDYFTDQLKSGTIHFTRKKQSIHLDSK